MFKLSNLALTITFFLLCNIISAANSIDGVPVDLAFVPCSGTYALCYYAKCKLNTDGSADCGCMLFNKENSYSFVNINHIYPAALQEETLDACPNGLASCLHNEAPICKHMHDNLMSTFNTGEPIFNFAGAQICGTGKYANCMTAMCEEKTAFDGSPITCKCRVREGNFEIAKTLDGTCESEKGFVWSGLPVPH